MNTLQLQLNKKIAALSVELPHEYTVLRGLFLVVGVLILAYLYLVSASVLNVIAQREADQASASLQSNIGVSEGKYFSLSRDMTPARAAKLGLQPVAQSSFVYRLDTVGIVSAEQNAI